MKDIYKNPITYYIAVPVILLIWPLAVKFVYIPKVEDNWQKAKTDWLNAEKDIDEIVNKLDPERLDYADSNNIKAEFDYVTVVVGVTKECGIADQNYTISNKPTRRSQGRKTKSARVMLQEVDIKKFAKFMTILQLRWASLQCEGITLTKIKGVKDSWKADIDFVYYF
jgi:hypothetical protein